MKIKPPENWKQGEAVPGIYKEQLLISLGKELGLKTLCETGTSNGSTLMACAPHFKELHSIELSEKYFNDACEKFKGIKNVELYHANSGQFMQPLLNKLDDSPKLFWCDAHPCGQDSANEGDPLPMELKTIMKMSPNSLILVDDEPNAELTRCNINWNGWVKVYHSGIIFIHKGQFKIDFE